MPGRCASISSAGLDYQNKLARFLENHDEPRAAATFAPGSARGRGRHHVPVARACGSSIRGSSRGGRSASRRTSCARRRSQSTRRLQRFYDRLLAVLRQPAVRDGQWQLLECAPAWDGNWTWDCFIAWCLARPGRPAAAGRRQLCREPEPVLRPAAVPRSGRPRGAAQGSDGPRPLRSRRERPGVARSLSRRARRGATTCSR